ncbi:hypothetical protein O6H91_02G030600 [Diphasiastrum complanatum]|uniref:Uncharacterized protein n=2 Tax=Diphasiastrum complanatum TaxID=34168 RepID=A0ACC2EE10_DIPCM|nr:hypothetical protein O6H91_02G030600 [Diphasiastrum complanatum]KAJ7564724.1 hypothetical protein O6H91_02G030600 [Diphasiastrum complanatum]
MALVRPRLFESSLKWRRAFCNAAQVTLDMNTWSLPIQDIEEHRNGSKMGIQWVFLGCPGVGKGTYASKLASLLSIPHIAMGDLIRQELTKPSLASKKVRYFGCLFFQFITISLYGLAPRLFINGISFESVRVLVCKY